MKFRRKKQPAEPASAPEAPDAEPRYGHAGAPFTRSWFHNGFFLGLGLLLAYLLYLSVQVTLSWLIIIAVAAFLAIGLNPLVVRIQRWGVPRGVAVSMVCLAAVLVLCGGFFALVPPAITQGAQFIKELPDYVTNLSHQKWLINLDKKFDLLDQLKAAAKGIDTKTVINTAGGVASILGVAIGTVVDGFMIALLTIYFLVSFNRMKDGFYKLLPASRRERASKLGDEILAKVGAYTVGALGIAATAGVSSFVFMIIAGIPFAIALAFVVAILDLIPQIGATLGAVVVTLVGLTQGVWVGLAAAIFFILYQQLENWVIYPTIMRRSVKVTDLAAILGILVGAALLGVVGALLAVPTVAAIQLIVREVYIPRQDAA
ncbi:MAG TPA: AI-2E family transporter [Stackebrandtia sp.]|jgi:predicted PurR-regulated permease PerM|uniref:AI-2E family transporter n=1 Tax=Stackebrandtia sp. TaxID=2023065 RepID=UPI002D6BFE22|nr:AI-2E family transporter [Stackebrandtia sp.]HZE40406.1 AI-2E family transporter [Stackebrandtia sp.]